MGVQSQARQFELYGPRPNLKSVRAVTFYNNIYT